MKNKLTTKSNMNGVKDGGDFDESEADPLQFLIRLILRATQTQKTASQKLQIQLHGAEALQGRNTCWLKMAKFVTITDFHSEWPKGHNFWVEFLCAW